ncbi:MAG TPA: preprotein translocase subunit SecA [Thermodesulfobacteriota bacterium]|nr:preprotein translocase subunit SecA [Thermodesulfobacteriota bacterium]
MLARKIFGSQNERDLKRLHPYLERINSLEPAITQLSDAELRARTLEFKERHHNGESLDDLLPETFAVVREAARRTLGERHYDVQIIGGIALHQGKIAEMATGEGKTLVSTLPAYLNAITGRGVHIVTVNDYLAKRDRDWMGKIYEFLGITVDVIQHDIDPASRKKAYEADITYGTNTEFGFDYLRDNMTHSREGQVQGDHYYAIVDEVDSILIDEARTPLIISGPVEKTTNRYAELDSLVRRLMTSQTILVNNYIKEAEDLLNQDKEYEAGIKLLQAKRGSPKNKRLLKLLKEGKAKKLVDRVELDYIRDKRLHELDEELYFSIEEKNNVVDLTDRGRHALAPGDPEMFIIPDLSAIDEDGDSSESDRQQRREQLEKEYMDKGEKIQNVHQLLKAYSLFEKDVDYVVSDGKVLIVDEFTGRILPGRRYSDGLHQALEAKEQVTIEGETQTFATITLQNYFRMYEKMAGMTGTAETEAPEFMKIYKLDVLVIPTNEPVRRTDHPDVIYRTKGEKYRAVINEILAMHEQQRPVLVGTTSVEVSETLSRMLGKRVKHSVLNAKRHREEAEIVANAGQPGAVTIATNMAGRGTDIKLGPGVPQKGGLHIVGTERHESRRIDRQLRGRSGRQGDPGSSRFFLSLEDDLLRIFGSERISTIMEKLGMQEGEPIEHSLITRAIENAQGKVEAHNFEIRKHLLEYDDVMNKQREVIYNQRNRILSGEDIHQDVLEMIEELVDDTISQHVDPDLPSAEWDYRALEESFFRLFAYRPLISLHEQQELVYDQLRERLLKRTNEIYEQRRQEMGEELFRNLEMFCSLQAIDLLWKEHLLSLDHLREGIGLRGYAQRNPLHEYQKEAFELFQDLVSRIKEETVSRLFRWRIAPAQSSARITTAPPPEAVQLTMSHGDQADSRQKTIKRSAKKVGRNDPCPCGSGKKYKKCCGQQA